MKTTGEGEVFGADWLLRSVSTALIRAQKHENPQTLADCDWETFENSRTVSEDGQKMVKDTMAVKVLESAAFYLQFAVDASNIETYMGALKDSQDATRRDTLKRLLDLTHMKPSGDSGSSGLEQDLHYAVGVVMRDIYDATEHALQQATLKGDIPRQVYAPSPLNEAYGAFVDGIAGVAAAIAAQAIGESIGASWIESAMTQSMRPTFMVSGKNPETIPVDGDGSSDVSKRLMAVLETPVGLATRVSFERIKHIHGIDQDHRAGSCERAKAEADEILRQVMGGNGQTH